MDKERTLMETTVGVHGGNILSIARELSCPVTELCDMSSNLTPFGMVPGLKEELIAHLDEVSYLPETSSRTLCEVFAGKYGLEPGQVLAGNGTTEFIYGVPAALSLTRALVVAPTYADYALAAQRARMEVSTFLLPEEEGFRLDLDRLGRQLSGGELVFICNPNNPTAAVTASGELFRFITAHPESVFLVDESYLPFIEDERSLLYLGLPDNLYLLFSASKIYGIPGLRLGFLAGSAARIDAVRRFGKPWGVNRLAQVAGEYVLAKGDGYRLQVARFVAEERARVVAEVARIPAVAVVEGRANFILCRLEGSMRAELLRERLLAEEKIIIRNCANFTGLDGRYFRFSLKEPHDNDRLVRALTRILGG